MGFIDTIKLKARQDRKTIVLPETMDERVLEAADKILKEDFCNIILLGDRASLMNGTHDFSRATIINPKESELTDELISSLYELRKDKGMSIEEARDLVLNDGMYFACMLVKMGRADGVVSGACHTSANTLRPALQIIKTAPGYDLVSSFFIMVVPDCSYGDNGVFVFSDCGLEQNPDSNRLADIAGASAKTFETLVGGKPFVAMLSHSTFGSSKHSDVDKVVEATSIAKEKYPQYEIDGELQLDAAIDEEVAKIKAPESSVAGKANVLVFPDLDAGNIGYKLVNKLAKAEAYGPLTQGIAAPINDLSRSCSADDIVGVVAISAVQASNTK